MASLPHGPFSSRQVESPYYPSQSHEAARKAALLCLGDGEKGVFLAGPSGSGKTTVLRQILQHQAVPDEVLFVHSALPLTRRDLIQCLLFDCQLPVDGSDVELHLRLMDHLAAILGKGQPIWIVLDDADLLDSHGFAELVGLTRLPGQSGARLQIIFTGDRPSWESDAHASSIPRVDLASWGANELADWIRQLIGAVTGHPMPGPEKVLMDLIAPGGAGLPGHILATLRCAWRLVEDPAVVYPNAENLSQALQRLSPVWRKQNQRSELRPPILSGEDLPPKLVIPNQPEMDFEGIEEWMAGGSRQAFSWVQGG